ncbi:MAG: cache domain-containing protein [Deltaproteobacteria bacterium]|jgi:PAS domain S-box-containing protein|nr:cache domain-containing protein [Deltaproteobacteria bacterium]
MLKEPKHALAKVIPLLLTAVSLASIILMAVIWINYEITRSRQESQRIASEYYEQAESSLSMETNRICEYIDAQTSASQVKFYINIKNKVLDIGNMLSGLEEDPRLAALGQRATKDIVLAMLDHLSFSGEHGGYFCTTSEGEVLLGWHGREPGFHADRAVGPGPGGAQGEASRELHLEPESLAKAIESVKAIGEGFYRIGLQEGRAETPTTFLRHYPKFDWILGASGYYSDFEGSLGAELLRWADNVPLPPEESLIIINHDGDILSYGDPALVGRNIFEEDFDQAMSETLALVITEAREKGKGLARFSLPDSYTGQPIDCVAYYRNLGGWKWVVVSLVSSSVLDESLAVLQSDLERNLRHQTNRVLAISLGMLAMVAIISVVVSRKLGSSVSAFTRFFGEAATGSVEIDPRSQPFTELARLAKAANSMIEQRREAARRLAESEAKFRTVFEVSPQIITIMDSLGRLLEANGQFERYAGCSFEQARGRCLADILDIPKGTWAQFMDDLTHQDMVSGTELVLRDHGGREVFLLLFGKLMTYMDQQFVLGVSVDITDLRLAETEKLELKEKLSRSQRMEAMGLMAAAVAHELNNILSGLIGYPELLLRDETLGPAHRATVAEILDAGQRAADVVGDMMTLSRGVAKAKVDASLSELVEKSLASPPVRMALAAAKGPIGLSFAPPAKDATIKASPRHLVKAIQHLVVNAIEAVDLKGGAGRVEIGLETVRPGTDTGGLRDFGPGNLVRLSIADDGPGIPQDEVSTIFEPFYSKKGDAGRGLGLAVVDLIVREHGGAIEVNTGTGGTTFNLFFKALEKSAKGKGLPVPDELKGQGQKILVVDDMDIQRKLAQKMLRTLGYDPHSVSSGEEAVEYLKKSEADLVILDMIMDPGINGRQTYEAILAIKPDQKAIIASGMAETDEVEKAQALGASYFVSKPYTIDDIAGAVFKALHPEAP